jgi:transcriptional regulator with XRE-family HTH domain
MLMASLQHWITVTPQDKRFYAALGRRVAEARKAQSFTQQQLAKRLGISQQTLAHYEVGRLRIAVAMLPMLAKELNVSVEDLIGYSNGTRQTRRGPTPKLQRQIEQVRQLPRAKQRFVIEMLDTVLQQSG